jgi:hypothetical protein
VLPNSTLCFFLTSYGTERKARKELRHFEKRHFQYHLQSQKFGVVKVSEFSTAATVHNTVF